MNTHPAYQMETLFCALDPYTPYLSIDLLHSKLTEPKVIKISRLATFSAECSDFLLYRIPLMNTFLWKQCIRLLRDWCMA